MQIIHETSSSLNLSMTAEPFLKQYYVALEEIKKEDFIPLRQIIYDLSGGETPKAKGNNYLEETDENAVPFLRIQNIEENSIIYENLNYITPETHFNQLKRSMVRQNDVSVTITGRVGTACVIKEKLKININQHIVRFSVLSEFNPEFIAIYLNTALGKLLTNRFVTGGTRIALDYETLLDTLIPKLSLDKQNEVVSLYQDFISKINHIYDKLGGVKSELNNSIEEHSLNRKDINETKTLVIQLLAAI